MTEREILETIKESFNIANHVVVFEDIERKLSLVAPPKPFIFGKDRTLFLDLTILIGSRPIGVIEIKININFKQESLDQLKAYLDITKYRFGVLTDGNDAIIIDKYNNYRATDIAFKGVGSFIKNEISNVEYKTRLDKIKSNLRSKLTQSNIEEKELVELGHLYVDKINYSPFFNDYRFVDSYKSLSSKLESKFMLELLESNNIKRIYRYTGLQTAIKIVTESSYLMNGITGMNDISEITYADSVLRNTEENYETYHLNRIHNANRKFISCCSSEKDDLTMWRLYGDDSRGVCLEFQVKNEAIVDSEYFYLAKVSYANKDKTHPKLELLRIFVEGVSEAGEVFGMFNFDVWKHFFKPYEYHIEKEVRLLYFNNKNRHLSTEWNISSVNLITPFVKFTIDADFPLKLKKIIVGRNMTNLNMNFHQLKALTSVVNFGLGEMAGINVMKSNIKHYRSK